MTKAFPFYICPIQEVFLDGERGFSTYPNLIKEQKTKDGFLLNILVVGRRGLGSKTLINSIFASPIIKDARDDTITNFSCQLFESDICLNLSVTTIHDLNQSSIEDYIYRNNMHHFIEEQGLVKQRSDTRIHASIFMISDDKITENEINIMKALSETTNFIPIISKSDVYTVNELKIKKEEVLTILKNNGISMFRPNLDEIKDYEITNESNQMNNRLPLAVIGSEDILENKGIKLRVREYQWGTIDIESENTNDFIFLRKLLINNNHVDLIEKTELEFYNKFRSKIIQSQNNDKEVIRKRLNLIRREIEKLLNNNTEGSVANLSISNPQLKQVQPNK